MSTTVALSKREREKFAAEHPGFLTQVAKRCNVSHSLVSRVIHGLNTSKRISQAIDAEIRKEIKKLEKQQARWKAKLSDSEAAVA